MTVDFQFELAAAGMIMVWIAALAGFVLGCWWKSMHP